MVKRQPAEVGSAKVGPSEPCPFEVGPSEVGVAEFRVVEISLAQDSRVQIGHDERGMFEVDASKKSRVEINSRKVNAILIQIL